MAEVITALLTYGPLGIFSYILWQAYLKKDEQLKKDTDALQNEIKRLMESHGKEMSAVMERHSASLEELRKAHSDREKEVAQMLQSYGNSVVAALDQTHDLAERLWSIRK